MNEPKFNYEIKPLGGLFHILRTGGPAGKIAIFRARSRVKAKAFLQIYLMLSLPDRRKLRAAVTDGDEKMIAIDKLELMALKKLAVINGVLANSFKDQSAAREQRALTSVLIDVINRAEIANATTNAAERVGS